MTAVGLQHGFSCRALGDTPVTPRPDTTHQKSFFVVRVLAGFLIPFAGAALATLFGAMPLRELLQLTAGIVTGETLSIAALFYFVPEKNPFRGAYKAKKRG